MGIFGGTKKKVEDQHIDIPSDIEDIKRMVSNAPNVRMSQVRGMEESDVPVWNTPRQEYAEPQPKKWEPEPQEDVNQPSYAPLFVKIDRYRSILSALGSIKGAVGLVRNSFSALNELERARGQTMTLIQSALEKIDKKLDALDKELIRPTGFNTQASPEDYQDVHNVTATVSDLKGQIQQLRNELQQM